MAEDYREIERQVRIREAVAQAVADVKYVCDRCHLATSARPDSSGVITCWECQLRASVKS